MAENTKIEWTDHSLNAWIGCSVGCSYCYAANMAKRLFPESSFGKDAKYFPVKSFREKAIALNKKAERLGVRYRVFGNSMNDWLDPHVPTELLLELLDVISLTPDLDWILLTKLPENWKVRINDVIDLMYSTMLGSDKLFMRAREWRDFGIELLNLWVGITVTNQNDADKRIPDLLKIPADVRFLSVEPMLGKIDLELERPDNGEPLGIDLVICGAETGRNARPLHPDSVRSLRDQCIAAGVPFFFKGWGEWADSDAIEAYGKAEIQYCESTEDGGYERYEFNDNTEVFRVGKKKSGRILDGREWNQMPEVMS